MQAGFQGITEVEARPEKVKEQVVSEDMEVAGPSLTKQQHQKEKRECPAGAGGQQSKRRGIGAGFGDLLELRPVQGILNTSPLSVFSVVPRLTMRKPKL